MKKLMLLLMALVAIAVPVRSQEVVRDPHAGPIQSVGAPEGACQSWQIDVDTTTGNFYTCNQGEWNLSSSTGTIGSGTKGQPTIYSSGSAISSSNQNLDVSAFHVSANKFTDDIVAGNTAMASGGTLIVHAAAPARPARDLQQSAQRPRRFLFIPVGAKTFTMHMDDADTIGSVLKCMDKVHQRGGGTCEIPAHSLTTGKHDTLIRKYADVSVLVKN
jgi:hypothetical protein